MKSLRFYIRFVKYFHIFWVWGGKVEREIDPPLLYLIEWTFYWGFFCFTLTYNIKYKE